MIRRLASVAALALGLAGGAGAASAQAAPPIVIGHIDGPINPITARYVDRLVEDGERRGIAALILVIDTPGGLIDATYKITGRLLNARVPVVTFVAPSGARAASAGAFITLAGHVAAMAPATNIGAAHPVNAGGGDIEGDLRDKAVNDAVAQITKIAIARGRNAAWAEDAVRKSVSVRDDEAVKLSVVDMVARDLPDLIAKLDGRTVKLPSADVRLATAGAPVEDDPRTPLEQFLHFITDPQIAVLLFTLGTYGLIFELSNPSLIFPGVVGVIAIVLALFAFGTLDANAAGIALMAFAVLLFLAEIWVTSHGILAAGGVAALLIGTLIVFPPGRPTLPGFHWAVAPWTVLVVAGTAAVFAGVFIRQAWQMRHAPSEAKPDVVGSLGVAKSDLDPIGVVHAAGEDWTAESSGGRIASGSAVRVRRAEGLRLIVEPASTEGKGT